MKTYNNYINESKQIFPADYIKIVKNSEATKIANDFLEYSNINAVSNDWDDYKPGEVVQEANTHPAGNCYYIAQAFNNWSRSFANVKYIEFHHRKTYHFLDNRPTYKFNQASFNSKTFKRTHSEAYHAATLFNNNIIIDFTFKQFDEKATVPMIYDLDIHMQYWYNATINKQHDILTSNSVYRNMTTKEDFLTMYPSDTTRDFDPIELKQYKNYIQKHFNATDKELQRFDDLVY